MVEEFTFEPELARNERRVRARFDYDPSTLSPNDDPDLELKFKAGDVIIVSGRCYHINPCKGRTQYENALFSKGYLHVFEI